MIRLDKYLADSGFGTRNEVRSLVKSGSVFVNNEIVKDFGIKIDPDKDEKTLSPEDVIVIPGEEFEILEGVS